MTKPMVNLLPPAMVAVVLSFWAFAPEAVLKNPWTLPAAVALITTTVLLLETVFERHAGWRMNRRELFTDLFYVVLNATLIAWASQILAEEPLRAAKAALGLQTEWLMKMPFLPRWRRLSSSSNSGSIGCTD